MIAKIAEAVRKEGLDGWLFYNFRNMDPSADSILEMPAEQMLTRRWFYFVPSQGEPVKLVHAIEAGALDHLPGSKVKYAGWKELHSSLQQILAEVKNICMQYSPLNAVPYVSYVDAGTLEMVRSTGVNVHSSANLIQFFEAIWSEEAVASHNRAVLTLRRTVGRAFACVKNTILEHKDISEYQLQCFIIEELDAAGLIFDHAPIVAVNAHAADPHYEPTAEKNSPIKPGDLLLIDLWAKEKKPEAVYGDITWMGFVGAEVPPKYAEVFDIVKNARDAAVDFIATRLQNKEQIHGYEVDDVCRGVITKAGYGPYFIHRTGHSIGQGLHWKGVNIDNLETKDERKLIDGIGFSIEPGIYLEGDFGVRSELDAYIKEGVIHVSGQPVQQAIIPILAMQTDEV